MGVNEIATMLDDKYDIQFNDDDMKEITSLNSTVDLLLRKIAH
jgi:acyl carrier protein